jgi:energy-coupling factor transport system permease protein
MYPRRVIEAMPETFSRADAPHTRPGDPRAVLVAVVALVTAALVGVGTRTGMLALLSFTAAWHLAATASVPATSASLWRIVPLALVVVVLNAVFGPGEALVTVAGLRVAADVGLANGVFFALRLSVMLLSVSLLLTAVTPEGLSRGVYDLLRRVSPRAAERAGLYLFLAAGFVPLVGDELKRIRVAQSFRTGPVSRGLRDQIDMVRTWMIPLLVSAIHRSGQLAIAIELRDIRHRLPRAVEAPRMRAIDGVLLASTAAMIVFAARLGR